MMDLFFCHLATFFINLGENWLILKPCLTAALEVNLNADFDNRTLQSLSILATTSQSYFFGTQRDFQSGVDKQKNQLTLDFMGQNLDLCVFILKVVQCIP